MTAVKRKSAPLRFLFSGEKNPTETLGNINYIGIFIRIG